jgi:ribosome recycling factor
MAKATFELDDIRRRMQGAVNSFKTELSGLRTGRASAALLDPVMVDAYGSAMPLNQVATVSVPESRMLLVQVWDRSMVASVERAIRESGLGLNPMTEGATLRLPIPELNTERRRELTKVLQKYAEHAKVAVRHVRRDGLDLLKRLEKDGDISEDDERRDTDLVQKVTDSTISEIDVLAAAKEKEIMQI